MLLLLFVCLFAFGKCQGPGEPSLAVIFDSPIYPFGEDSQKFIDTSQIFVERYNETIAYMHGSVVFLQRMDKRTILQIIILKESSPGKYEIIFNHDICDLCLELGDESSYYKKHLNKMELPSECPIEPGAYKVNDLLLDVDELNLQSTHTGRYEVQLVLCVQTGEDCQQDRDCKCTLKLDLMVEQV